MRREARYGWRAENNRPVVQYSTLPIVFTIWLFNNSMIMFNVQCSMFNVVASASCGLWFVVVEVLYCPIYW